jgi:predicted transposase YbfD/YdcC
MLPNPMPYFEDLKDPRRETKNKLHKLNDIVMIVLCAVLSGVEDWVGMEEFAKEKAAWFRGFLELPNGIPSHDTLSDVLGRIDPQAFRDAFLCWVQAALPSLSGEQLCLDGKTLRGSRSGDKAVHLPGAYAAKARWVLVQQAVGEKTNEITAIPDLLSQLDIAGTVVSIDAMGCQKAIAQTIVDAKADYVLALKDNHKALALARYRNGSRAAAVPWNGGQGSRTLGNPPLRLKLPDRLARTKAGVERFAQSARRHGCIENRQHWVLDVQFGEDGNRARKDHSPENLALIRRMALNLLDNHGPSKDSLRRRKLRACLSDRHRGELIFGKNKT